MQKKQWKKALIRDCVTQPSKRQEDQLACMWQQDLSSRWGFVSCHCGCMICFKQKNRWALKIMDVQGLLSCAVVDTHLAEYGQKTALQKDWWEHSSLRNEIMRHRSYMDTGACLSRVTLSLHISKALLEKWRSYFLSTSYTTGVVEQEFRHIFSEPPERSRTSACAGGQMPCPQPDLSPDDKLHRQRLASHMPLYPVRPQSSGLSASAAASVPAWQMPRRCRCEWCGGGGGWQNRAKSLCNQRVWLGGDGGSAGTQTFTIGQAVLVNRSGCTKEAGWIIDRM